MLIPQDHPKTWKVSLFGKIADIVNGQVSPKEEPYIDYYHIGPENIVQNTGQLVNLKTSRALNLISGKYLFDDSSIVYSKIRPNLNKVCLPDFTGICSADAYPIKPKDGRITREFLFHYMLSQLFVRQSVSCSMRTGLPKINRQDLNAIKVLLPPLSEQKKIAEILGCWNSGIERLENLIAAKWIQKKSLMQQLLTGKKRFKEFKGQKWKYFKASELFRSFSKKNNDDEELLSATQDKGVVPRRILDGKVMSPEGSLKSYKLVEPGDFVISLRSFQGGLEYSEYRGLVSPAYTVLKPNMEINNSFYKHYFKSYDFIGHLAVAVIGIRDGKQISYDDFAFLNLPYPPIKEQQKIASVLNASDREIELLCDKLEALKTQKKGLMQKLLTGKIRVKV
jgi:type I restriction enzyme S subunit